MSCGSQYPIKSNWCLDEAGEGLERQCLVPLLIDDLRPPLGFRSSQTALLIGWPQQHGEIDQLIAGVRECLVAPVSTVNESATGTETVSSQRSIVVLPFANRSSDPDQEYFCDGLVEDIIAELSHIPNLLVISRNTTFLYKESSPDVVEIAAYLGVNFVLQGSVRRMGDHVRVTAILKEASTAKTIWSNRYDRDISDVFTVQDELTNEIVTALDVELISGEQGRHRRSKYRSTEAGEILYKGMFEHYKFDQYASMAARTYFEKFVSIEPDSILGYAWLVHSWSFALIVGWEAPELALQKLREFVDKSLTIDGDDAHALVGDTYYKTLVGDLDGALESVERATSILPNLDEAWFARGWVQMLLGNPHQSVKSIKRSMRLCPILNTVKFGVLATAYRNAERYEEAIQTFNDCLKRFPDFIYAHSGLAMVYGLKGDNPAAEREVNEVLAIDPGYTIERFITPNLYRDKSIMGRCADALRSAGMPEN